MRMILAATCLTVGLGGLAHAQKMTEPVSNDDYMKRVMQAAPPQIVSDATVVRMQNDNMADPEEGNQRMDLHVPSWRAHVFGPERHGMGTCVADPRPSNGQDRVHLHAGR